MPDGTARRRGWVALLLLLAAAAPLAAQTVDLPSAPVPVAPVLPLEAPAPLAYTPPPPPPPIIGPAFDPGRDGWGPFGQGSCEPGWFVNAQVAVVFPAVKFRITNDMPLPTTGQRIQVPSVDLDTAVSPQLEVGYRLPGSAGLFAVNYGFLASEGTGTAPATLRQASIDSAVRTRLNVNWLDLDYGTAPFEVAPRWDVSYRIGARIANVFFDSRATNADFLEQASNNFFGAGPRARIDVERRIVTLPGLALFGRAEGAALIGQVEQRFRLEDPPGGGGIVDSASVHRSQLVPAVTLQAGLSYCPPGFNAVKLTSGYEYGQYFNSGRLGIAGNGEVSQSRGDFWWHGWFLRGQVDF
jgi:hypothetical protein